MWEKEVQDILTRIKANVDQDENMNKIAPYELKNLSQQAKDYEIHMSENENLLEKYSRNSKN